ncbi:MAG: hypothetical protein R2771_09520 [Saprospiraceae bacterium]
MNNKLDINPVRLGDSINTTMSEYLPVLTGDKEEIVFTRRVDDQEDIYYSKLTDSIWSAALTIVEYDSK